MNTVMLEKLVDKYGFLCYDEKTIVTQTAGAVPLPDWVNGLTVENSGNTNLFWDNNLIVPGDFKAVGGNYGERYVGDCTLKFALPVPAPAAPENMATVSCKFYVRYNY
jgi:hypothetical protein